MLFAGEAVQLQVLARPVEIGVGEVDRERFPGTSRGRVDSGRARVAEQIEKALVLGLTAQAQAHGPMVEEEPRIEVVGEVHQKAQAALLDFVEGAFVAKFFVLPMPPLALAHLEVDIGWQHAQHARDGGERLLKPPLGLVQLDALGRGVFLDMNPALIEVDGQRIVGQIRVIDAKAAHARAARPLRQVAKVLGQAVDEPLRFLAHANGGRRRIARQHLGGSSDVIWPAEARRFARSDRDLQEPALDRAVVEDVAALDAQADFLGEIAISREDIASPASEALLEDIAQALIEPPERADLAQALAIGRVGHQDAARNAIWPHRR